jgi:hypothetical protein
MASRNNLQKWRALGADRASVAEARMEKVLTELRTARKVRVSVRRGVMSFADAASVWEARVKADPDLADRTKEFYFYGLAKLRKSWPEMDKSPAEKITRGEIETWRERLLKSAPYVPPKAKTAMRNSTGCRRTTTARSAAVLRTVLDIALESG